MTIMAKWNHTYVIYYFIEKISIAIFSRSKNVCILIFMTALQRFIPDRSTSYSRPIITGQKYLSIVGSIFALFAVVSPWEPF